MKKVEDYLVEGEEICKEQGLNYFDLSLKQTASVVASFIFYIILF
jgi:hypothetical protein